MISELEESADFVPGDEKGEPTGSRLSEVLKVVQDRIVELGSVAKGLEETTESLGERTHRLSKVTLMSSQISDWIFYFEPYLHIFNGKAEVSMVLQH